jgi:hypothetical protein
MIIKDITLSDIRSGINWKLVNVDCDLDDDLPMENWSIEPCNSFTSNDTIVYSGVSVTDKGIATPLICIREVQDLDYGGDYCEYVHGNWRQVGLQPNPNAPHSEEFNANPLPEDPSFESPTHDYREYHRNGFHKWVLQIDKTNAS